MLVALCGHCLLMGIGFFYTALLPFTATFKCFSKSEKLVVLYKSTSRTHAIGAQFLQGILIFLSDITQYLWCLSTVILG